MDILLTHYYFVNGAGVIWRSTRTELVVKYSIQYRRASHMTSTLIRTQEVIRQEAYLAHNCTPNMEAVRSSETSVSPK
jgi:hypothetical protein